MSRTGTKKLKYDLLYLGVKGLIWTACRIPRKLMMSIAGSGAKLVYRLMASEREKTIRHLSIAYGENKSPEEIEKMALKSWENIGRNVVDIIRYPTIKTLDDYKKIVKVEGLEHLEEAHKSGKGVITLTAHLGAFEMTATYILELGLDKMSIVGTALKDARLNDLLTGNRTLKGATYIPRGESTIKLVKALKRGEFVALLIDQDTDKVQNVFVDFYGKKTSTPIGATVLAMRTGALVVPMAIRRQADDTHLLTFKPALELVSTGDKDADIVTNTQILSNSLEDFIKEYPEQWIWMHERWKTRPEGEVEFA